jgi:hypothetical protein
VHSPRDGFFDRQFRRGRDRLFRRRYLDLSFGLGNACVHDCLMTLRVFVAPEIGRSRQNLETEADGSEPRRLTRAGLRRFSGGFNPVHANPARESRRQFHASPEGFQNPGSMRAERR